MAYFFPVELQELDNPHLIQARKLFATGQFHQLRQDIRYIFICFTNRCGSNFLAESLASGQFLNPAGEYFNAETMTEVANAKGLQSLEGYFNFLAMQEAMNGTLVAKISLHHLAILHEFGLLGYFLKNASFVFLHRRDLLGQAISMQIASQTKSWKSVHDSLVPDDELHVSLTGIAETIDDFAYQNYLWTKFFAHNDVRCLALTYEDLMEEPLRVLSRITNWLDVPEWINLANVSLKMQRRAVNERFRDIYLQRL